MKWNLMFKRLIIKKYVFIISLKYIKEKVENKK